MTGDDRSPPAAPLAPDAEPKEPEPALAAGETIGRYELLGMLGAGGMSYVYLAHDPELDRKVALKLMRAKMLGPDGARRLHREAQALARLSHPNVVPVYDVGLAGGQAYVAMEYVEGKTLRTWLRDARSWREILSVMVDAGRGLAAAHAAGLVHRDFKPDNVLIGKDARVRVLDFGLARLASVLDGTASTPSLDNPPSESGARASLASPAALITRADQVIGTPAYMAPEQVRRDHTDERADQFSYCVTLYEALFGERPFGQGSKADVGSSARTVTLELRGAALRTPKPPPRGTKVPRWLQRVVLRGLAYRAEDRHASMDALLAALTSDPWRPWRRAAAAAAVVALAGAAALGVARASSRDRAMCHGGEGRAAAVWGPKARGEVRAAFEATGLPYASEAAAAATRSLDAYVAEWAKESDEACAATRVRGEQSEEVLDLREACLTARLREVASLVEMLRRADDGTVKQASRAASTLPSLALCADVAELRGVPRPRDAAVAAKVEELEGRLADVEAAYAVGKEKQAAEDVDPLVDDAKKVAFGPLVARAELWRGRANADLGASDRSIPAFRDAFAAALSSREDRVLKESAARLAQEYIYAREPGEFAYWAEVAQAAIDRGPPDPVLQSFLDHTRCVAMWQEGKITERLECLERHAAKVERTRALDEWELTTLGLAATDAGQLERGLAYVKRGYAYALRLNGPLHPRTLEMRAYVVKAELEYGDFDAALAEGRAALARAEEAAAENAYVVARIRLYLGITSREAGDFDGACAELRAARAGLSDPTEVDAEIADVDVATGHPELAVELLRRTLAETQKVLAPEHPNVIMSQAELGKALLVHGAVAEARALLDGARALAAHAELSPETAADVEFADARALYAAAPGERPRALELARHARDLYAANSPKTPRWDAAIATIDRWLAHPAETSPPNARDARTGARSRCEAR